MSKCLRSLIVGIAIAITTPALAQAPEQDSTAAARAIIQAAGLSDVFAPVEDESVSVRHAASGLVCRFYGETRRVAVFPNLPRGEDVACVDDTDTRYTTLYATRYAPPPTPEEALAIAVAAIRQRFADARPTPQTVDMQPDSLPRSRSAHFLVTINGERWITSAHVARVGDWTVKLRYSARCMEDREIMRHQLEAGALFTLALMNMGEAA